MLATLERRGPDDHSVHQHEGILLGHTRLSIIDIEGGRQPLFNETGDVACIFNGEIYNYRALRKELLALGHKFRSASDTEVIVHGYESWGQDVLNRLRGMFAIVIANLAERTLLIARDRMGEKPLYYIDRPDFFACASELKALRLHPGARGSVSRTALRGYLQYAFVPGRESIYEGIHRLGPGEYMEIGVTRTKRASYWRGALQTDPALTRPEVVQELPELVIRATRAQMVADVPVGVFLSGGLDSSVVVAAAARSGAGTLRTFSIGFEGGVNELPHARSIAEMYSTEHTEIVLKPDARELVDGVLDYFDEPFADSSSAPTYAVAREARRHVKVALTGDGGDELYCGYGAYLNWRHYSRSRLIRLLGRCLQTGGRALGIPEPIERVYPLPLPQGADSMWELLRSTFTDEEVCGLLGMKDCAPLVAESQPFASPDRDPISQAVLFDLNNYLPHDLLKKVDMASMANSLESRAPLLDLELVEFMSRVPSIEKVRGGQTKSLIREAFAPWLPKDFLSRSKQGFGAPVISWLEGPLSPRVGQLRDRGRPLWKLLSHSRGERMVDEKLRSIRQDWRSPHALWLLMMLDGWAERHCPDPTLS